MSDVPDIPGSEESDPLDTDSAGEFVAPVRVFVPIDPDDPGGWAREEDAAMDPMGGGCMGDAGDDIALAYGSLASYHAYLSHLQADIPRDVPDLLARANQMLSCDDARTLRTFVHHVIAVLRPPVDLATVGEVGVWGGVTQMCEHTWRPSAPPMTVGQEQVFVCTRCGLYKSEQASC